VQRVPRRLLTLQRGPLERAVLLDREVPGAHVLQRHRLQGRPVVTVLLADPLRGLRRIRLPGRRAQPLPLRHDRPALRHRARVVQHTPRQLRLPAVHARLVGVPEALVVDPRLVLAVQPVRVALQITLEVLRPT
jgi:hypothetical protein